MTVSLIRTFSSPSSNSDIVTTISDEVVDDVPSCWMSDSSEFAGAVVFNNILQFTIQTNAELT